MPKDRVIFVAQDHVICGKIVLFVDKVCVTCNLRWGYLKLKIVSLEAKITLPMAKNHIVCGIGRFACGLKGVCHEIFRVLFWHICMDRSRSV